jgi:hypothetical protein
MPWVDVDQNSVDWLKMRIACVTASRVFDIVDRLKVKSKNGEKGDYKQSRQNYMVEIAAEHLTGRASDHYVNDWMIRGQEDEPLAQQAYEELTGEMVTPGGFYLHDSIQYFGASPDYRISENGLLELKNLKPENHLRTIQAGVIPNEYIWQMNAQLACAPEREFVDYGSFCKEIRTPGLKLFVRRHYRDKQRIAELEEEVQSFLAELAAMMQSLAACKPILEETSV